MTAKETAEYLRVSEVLLAQWRYKMTPGSPKWIKVGGAVRYRLRDIEEYLDRRTRKPKEKK